MSLVTKPFDNLDKMVDLLGGALPFDRQARGAHIHTCFNDILILLQVRLNRPNAARAVNAGYGQINLMNTIACFNIRRVDSVRNSIYGWLAAVG